MKFIRYFIITYIILFSHILLAADNSEKYKEAADCYHSVKSLSKTSQTRVKWHKCARLFDNYVGDNRSSEKTPDALYSAGLSYRNIYDITQNESDAGEAIDRFNRLVRFYSKSSLADDALFNIATLKWEVFKDSRASKSALAKIIRWYHQGDMIEPAKSYLKKLTGESADKIIRSPRRNSRFVKLTKIDRTITENGEKARLSISGPVEFKATHGRHTIKNLRLYTLELKNTYLSRLLDDDDYSYIGKGPIRDVLASQVNRDKAEINFVIKKGYHCNSLRKKGEIEVRCKEGEPKSKAPVITVDSSEKGKSKKPPTTENRVTSIDKTQTVEKTTVVIDPGHGGKDFGAVGSKGTREKDVALQIAKRLGWQLRNKFGMDVNYTRINDRYISLDDRGKIANGFNADLFISIHANASESKKLDGYQTFYLNNATDKASRKLAAIENASLEKSMDDVEKIVLTMMQNANTDSSREMAKSIHKSVLSKMSIYGLKDRGIKSALFYVLVGAKCPSVLIETSFISNPDEELKLMNGDYQERIAIAIAEGIGKYLKTSKSDNSSL